MSDQFVNIRQQTGYFNFADPSEESTHVHVTIEEYDFDESFKFDPNSIHVTGCSWVEAIEVIVGRRHRYIRQKSHAEELEDLLEDHREELEREWAQHRLDQLDNESERISDEKARLEAKVND